MFYDSHQSRPQQLSWVKCYFENKKKTEIFLVLFFQMLLLGSYVPFWSEGWPLQDIVWKENQTRALVSVPGFCGSHATHFHTLGEMPEKWRPADKETLHNVIWIGDMSDVSEWGWWVVLSFFHSIDLSDWCATGFGWSENLKKLPGCKHCLPKSRYHSVKSFFLELKIHLYLLSCT